MAWNASGTFSRINTSVSPAAGATTIESSAMNTYTADVTAGINACLAKNGENSATGNLKLGGYQIKNAADGTVAADVATVRQVQNSSTTYAVASGTDTITLTLTPAITALAAGQTFRFKAAGECTGGGVTLNVNGLGAKSVVTNSIASPRAGDISTNGVYTVIYDGTRFLLQNPERETSGVFSNNSNGNPNVSDTAYTVTGLAASAWAEIGPTGATNAWAALDALPDDIDWIEVKASVIATNTAALVAEAYVYARESASSQGIGGANLVGTAVANDNTSNNKSVNTLQFCKIPVGIGKTFDVHYLETGTAIINFYLVGYGWN